LTAAFVMAGFFKATQMFAWLPYDLTLLLGIATGVAVIARLILSRIPSQIHGIIVGFMLLVPAVFTAAPTLYGAEKVSRLFTITLLATLAPVLLIRSNADVERFLWAWTGVSGIVVISALINPQVSSTYAGAPVTAEGTDTIGLGTAAGLVVIVIALALMWRRLPWYVGIPVGAVASIVLLQSGSRGPLIATVIGIVAGIVLPKVRPRRIRAVVVVALSAGALVTAFLAAPHYAQERIASVLEGRAIYEGTTRLDLYKVAWDSVQLHPLGIGWGRYEQIAFLGYRYPHNLYLEVLAEAGVIFGSLFLIWIVAYFLAARRSATTFASAALFSILCALLVEAGISGDINLNRMVFYAIGLTAAVRAVADHRAARTPPAGSPADVPAQRREPDTASVPGSSSSGRTNAGPPTAAGAAPTTQIPRPPTPAG
jgi:O-antigen ligase